MKGVLLLLVAAANAGYLTYVSYAKNTPIGAQNFQAEMRRDEVESNNKLAVEREKTRRAELELRQAELDKQR